MIALRRFFLTLFASPFKSKSRLEAENAALRHQLIVLQRRVRGRVHSAPHVDRRNRVQLVEKGGCRRVTSNNEIKAFPQNGGERSPCRGGGGGGVGPIFLCSPSERPRFANCFTNAVLPHLSEGRPPTPGGKRGRQGSPRGAC